MYVEKPEIYHSEENWISNFPSVLDETENITKPAHMVAFCCMMNF